MYVSNFSITHFRKIVNYPFYLLIPVQFRSLGIEKIRTRTPSLLLLTIRGDTTVASWCVAVVDGWASDHLGDRCVK